jgi:hypothetical protein
LRTITDHHTPDREKVKKEFSGRNLRGRGAQEMLLSEQGMICWKLVCDPHRQAVLNPGERHLVIWQRADLLVVDKQPIGIFDFQVVRISGFEFDYAAFYGIIHYHAQSFFEEPVFILEFLRHPEVLK